MLVIAGFLPVWVMGLHWFVHAIMCAVALPLDGLCSPCLCKPSPCTFSLSMSVLYWCWGQCRHKMGVRALSYPLRWQWKALLSCGSTWKASWRLVPGGCNGGNRGLTYFLEVWVESYAHFPQTDTNIRHAFFFSCLWHKPAKSCQKLWLT